MIIIKNLKFKDEKFIILFVLFLYLFISIFIYRSFIDSKIVISNAESFAPTLEIFLRNVVWEPSWHEMLSKPTRGWIYSPHFIFYFIGKVIKCDVPTLIKLEYIVFCALSGFSMFILSRYILKITNSNYKSKESIVACFFSGLMYMLNLSYRVGDIHYSGIQISFSIFPFIILFFLKAFHEKRYIFLILSGFFWVEAAAFDQRYLFTPLILILPYLLIFSINNNNVKHCLKTFFILSLVFLLLGGYYFFSMPHSVTVGSVTALTKPAVDITWSNGNVISLMRAASHFQLPRYIRNTPFNISERLIIFTGLMVFIFALLSIMFDKNNSHVLFFSSIVILTVGVFAGFGEFSRRFIYWLVIESPYSHFIGRAFRTTRIPDQIMITSLSILLAFSIYRILDKVNKTKYRNFLGYSILTLILMLILTSSAPLFTGDVAGRLHPVRMPKRYKDVNNWLQIQKGDFKVVWIPEFWGPYQPEWSKGAPVDALTYYGSSKPTYFARNNIMTHYYAYTLSFRYNSLIMRGQTQALYDFISPLNVKYIILHDDIPQYKERFAQALHKLKNDPNFTLVAKFEPLYIFEVINPDNHINTKDKPVLVYGGLEVGKSILKINNRIPLLFADEFKLNLINTSFIDKIILTSSKSAIDTYVSFIPEDNIIKPCYYSRFHQRDKWSRAYITDPHHGIWHNFINTFPNQKWEFSYGIQTGFVFISNGKDTMEIPVTIRENAIYLLFMRVLKSTKGGKVKITIKNFQRVINTIDKIRAEFVWIKVGEINLSKGNYKLEIENIKGSNAINIIILIPKDKLLKIEREIKKLLQNKTIIYLFEAETDLHKENAKVTKSINFSDGEVLVITENCKAWQDVEIVKNGTYRIALKGIGEFKVKIGNKTFVLNSNFNFTYSPLFYLEKGVYKLEIIPLNNNTKLDVIWLYSTETNQTIEELFEVKEKPAEVISYEKINPTLWKVKVNATKPFMLSFAEAYDPLWEARVYKNGKLIEKVRSLPLYSVINGFWINQTGNLEIVIRYVPQDWFEIGLVISGITFIGCIAYLFYDWKKEKIREWVRKLRRRNKKTKRKTRK